MNLRTSHLTSLVLHAGVVFALIHLSALQELPKNSKPPHLEWSSTKLVWHLPESMKQGNSRGGGSGHSIMPPSGGRLPRVAPRQFVPPTTRVSDHVPELPVEPTIVGDPQTAPAADYRLPLGDPTARLGGPPSDGTGAGAGIGNGGRGGGVGNATGPSTGDGSGGSVIGGRGRGGTTLPILVWMTEPEFTEEARKARMQGVVVLRVEIDEHGRVGEIRVQMPLGLGLDEKAIEAVRKWRFRPGTRDGRPVTMPALVEVNFRLL